MYLTETQEQVREMARAFADETIRPLAEELDREERFPAELYEEMAKLGLFGIGVPEALGGPGFDTVSRDFGNQTAAIVWNDATQTNLEFTNGACARNFERIKYFGTGSGDDSITQSGRVDNWIYTRAGNDWTKKWPVIADALRDLPVENAWVDGEVVAIDREGKVSFQALQNMMREGKSAQLTYYVFDLMYLNGFDLSAVPLVERKRLLKEVMDQLPEGGPLIYSDHMTGGAREVFEHVDRERFIETIGGERQTARVGLGQRHPRYGSVGK